MKTKLSLTMLVIVLLAACGPKASPTPAGILPPAQSGEIKIPIANFAFDPESLTITTGTTITWTNNDTVSHNVNGDDGTWGSKTLAQGDSFSYTFSKTGSYSYKCGFHPSMKATITVVSP